MTTTRSHASRALLGGIVTLCALCMTTRIGRAQTTDSTASDSSTSDVRHTDSRDRDSTGSRDRDSTSILVMEHRAELARRGAGLSIGTWNVQDLHATQGATYSITPAFEGYFQKGLDQHLAIETTAGLWRRTQLLTQPGSFGGDSTTQSVSSYIVPLFTTLKIYPFTKPSQHLEPYMLGGVGFALGIDDRRTSGSSGALLGGNAQPGVALETGLGFTGGAGIEWRFSSAFGLAAGTRYRWIRFLGDVGGDDTFKGMGFDAGVTYRFQY